jgi:DNA-directed RNA polymerase specialized sigma24 family protein
VINQTFVSPMHHMIASAQADGCHQQPEDDGVASYRRVAGELTRYATALVGPHDAPDVVSDAVLGLFRSRSWPTVTDRRASPRTARACRG